MSEYVRNKAGWRKAPENDDARGGVKQHINKT